MKKPIFDHVTLIKVKNKHTGKFFPMSKVYNYQNWLESAH